MIQIVIHRTEPGGPELLCPAFCCDVCHKIIDADSPGLMLYDFNASPGEPFSIPVSVHQGECDARLGQRGQDLNSHELREVVRQLAEGYTTSYRRHPGDRLRWLTGEDAK